MTTHERIEAEMEAEIDSLLATRAKSKRNIGVSAAPWNSVLGKRVGGREGRYHYGKTKVANGKVIGDERERKLGRGA